MSVHVCQRSMFAVSVAHCVCVLAPPLQVSSWERVCDLAEASSQRAVAHTWCWKVVVSNLRLRVYFWKHLGKLFKRSSVCVCVCVCGCTHLFSACDLFVLVYNLTRTLLRYECARPCCFKVSVLENQSFQNTRRFKAKSWNPFLKTQCYCIWMISENVCCITGKLSDLC